jgi:hypothetical protein
LIKYVSVPLLLVELWRGFVQPRRARYLLVVAATALASGLLVLPLWRGPAFFDPVFGMQEWGFLTPSHAAEFFASRLGVPVPSKVFTILFRIAFGTAALLSFARYVKTPTVRTLAHLTLVILSAVMFAGVSHVWPWFLVWIIGPAAVVGRGVLWRCTVAFALVSPFLNLFWLTARGWDALPLAGALSFGAVGALVAVPGLWHRLAWAQGEA